MIKNSVVIGTLEMSVELYSVLMEAGEQELKILLENVDTDKYNYLDVSTDGVKISYLSKDRYEKFEGQYFDTDKRKKLAYASKVGKSLKKVFVGKFTETQAFVSYVERVQAVLLANSGAFEVVEVIGKDIAYYYNEDNYMSDSIGQLANSCMRYNSCQGYFDIYVKNPKQVSLAIIRNKSNNKIKGRALVWHGVESSRYNGEFTLLDRIYSDEQGKEMLLAYASSRGYAVKTNPTSLGEYEIELPDGSYTSNYWIELDRNNFEEYPYIDTLCKWDSSAPNILFSGDADSCDVVAQETDGTTSGVTCLECGYSYNRDELTQVVNQSGDTILVCEDCLESDYTYIEEWEEFHHVQSDEIRFIPYLNMYVPEREVIGYDTCDEPVTDSMAEDTFVFCVDVECYVNTEVHEVYYLVDKGDYFYYESNVIEIDGEYYHKDNENIIYNYETCEYTLIK